MPDNFKEFLHCSMDKRMEELHQVLINNENYKKLTRQHSDLFEQIINSLPEDLKTLLYELDSKNSELSGMDNNFFYKHGFKDAFKMAKFLYD